MEANGPEDLYALTNGPLNIPIVYHPVDLSACTSIIS
jgi:hypothetical protein